MASPFKSLKVFLLSDNSRAVYWDFHPGIKLPWDLTLSVEYSRAGGTWQTLQEGLPLCYCYIDPRKTNRNKYNNDYYRVVLRGDGQEYISDPQQAGVSLVYPYSARGRNLIRLAQLEMARTGRVGFLMKKKTFGQKCPSCKHFQDDAPVNEHCPICLGTGIKGGYYKAIPMNILQMGQNQLQDITQVGSTHSVILQAKSTAWPIICSGDVWVDSNTNQRYYIQQAFVSSSLKHVPLIYDLKMHLLELSDVLHTQKAQQALQEAFVDVGDWKKEFEQL